MRFFWVTLTIICYFKVTHAQQYLLYNTQTLYDIFENPSQKGFHANVSRQFASNFLFPNFSIDASLSGPSAEYIRSKLFASSKDARSLLDPTNLSDNKAYVDFNMYLFALRMYKQVQYDQEMGISWQLRGEGTINLRNSVFFLADNDIAAFQLGKPYDDVFNGSFKNQAYHQISFVYRRNHIHDKNVGFGFKLSYLSGILHENFSVDHSFIENQNSFITLFKANATFKTTHPYDHFNVAKNATFPSFVNPGFSFALGIDAYLNNGWYVMGTLKDIGFIRWNSKSYNYKVDIDTKSIIDNFLEQYNVIIGGEIPTYISLNTSIGDLLESELASRSSQGGFTSLTNGKAQVLINRNIGFYRPNFILSKNLFNGDGDAVLANHFHLNKKITLSAAGRYNLYSGIQLGAQLMVKSSSFEFYLGSDQVIKSNEIAKGASCGPQYSGSGYLGASFYWGLGFNFGKVLTHRSNSVEIAGIRNNKRRKYQAKDEDLPNTSDIPGMQSTKSNKKNNIEQEANSLTIPNIPTIQSPTSERSKQHTASEIPEILFKPINKYTNDQENAISIPGIPSSNSPKRSNEQANAPSIPGLDAAHPIKQSNQQANANNIPRIDSTSGLKKKTDRKKQETASVIPKIKSIKPVKNYKK